MNSRQKTIGIVSIGLFLLLAAAAFAICFAWSGHEERKEIERQKEMIMALFAKRQDMITNFAENAASRLRLISAAEMFRMFLADRELMPDDESLVEQASYLNDVLLGAMEKHGFANPAFMLSDMRDVLDNKRTINPEQKALAEKILKEKKPMFGEPFESDGKVMIPYGDPVFDILENGEPSCKAALTVSIPVNEGFTKILDGDQYILVGNSCLLLGKNGQISLVKSSSDISFPLQFSKRKGLNLSEMTWSMGERTAINMGLVIQEPAETLDGIIKRKRLQIYGMGLLGTLGLTFIAAFAFASLTAKIHKKRADHLAALYDTINKQKAILDGINNSLETGLALFTPDGRIEVANPAFGKICATDNSQGCLLHDVFPSPERLAAAVSDTSSSKKHQSIEIQTNERLWRINLYPYIKSGCVAIFQDITDFRAAAKKSAQRQQALILAMDRALASVDPDLVGQSAKIAGISALLADRFNMDSQQKETLRLASLLSQIGKLFVPSAILRKKDRLTAEEKAEMDKAPEHADKILHDLHFDLPVRETVGEMNERLDGSGPKGMSEISPAGRILAISAALVAMTSNRSWRTGMDVKSALAILEDDLRFDQEGVKFLLDENIDNIKNILDNPQMT